MTYLGRALVAGALFALVTLGCREKKHEPEPSEPHEQGERHPEGAGVVQLSPSAIERSGIRIGEPSRQPLSGALVIPAEVRLDPDRTAHITPIVQSQVAKVRVKLGDRVVKGQPLAELRSVELGEANADIARARATVKVAEDRAARQRQLADAGVGAQRSLVEAEGELTQAKAGLLAAQGRARVYGGAGGGVVKSPMNATVIERHATPGEVCSPDKPLFVLADIDTVWVVGRVYEKDVGAVREGATATVRLGAHPSRSWSAKVDYVSPVLDEATRSAEVRVTLENSNRLLKPGLFGTIALGSADAGALSLAVPEAAVQELEGRQVVFVPGDEAGEFRAVPVTTGSRSTGWVEIVKGVSPGQKLVVDGAFTLKSALLASEMGEGHAH